MADRYWRGGTATWNTTNTTSWSTSSGGAGGASVPTSADDVFFDAGSDSGSNFTVTIGAGAVCRSMIVSGHDKTITFTGTGALTIHQDLNWIPVGTDIVASAFTGDFIFAGAAAIEQFISFSDIACGADLLFLGTTTTTYTFTSDFNGNTNASIELKDGILNTNDCTITVSFWTTQAGTSTTNLSASLIVITGTGGLVYGTGRTFNAGTSLIRFSNTSGTTVSITMPNYTLYNVAFNATTRGVFSINGNAGGNLTVNNLTVAASTNGRKWIALGGTTASQFMTLTINDTFTVNGTNARFAAQIVNNISYFSSPCTIDAEATDLNYVSFLGIAGAGTAAPFTGTAIGNVGNNSGITFTTPKTVYYRGSAISGHNWITAANTFGTTSGGSGANANFPLPQDTVIIDENTLPSSIRGGTPGDREIQFGTLDASARTTAISFAPDAAVRMCGESGELSTPSAFTWSLHSNSFVIHSAADLDITNSFNAPLLLRARKQDSPNYHTIRLTRNFTHNFNHQITNQGGYFDLNGYTLSAFKYAAGASQYTTQVPRGLIVGSGTCDLTYTASQTHTLDAQQNDGHVFDEGYINILGGTGSQTVAVSGGENAGMSYAPSIKLLGSFAAYDLQQTFINNLDTSDGSGTIDPLGRSYYGDVKFGVNTTVVSSTSTFFFIGGENQRFDTAGQNVPNPIMINKTAGTVTLDSNVNLTDSRIFTLTAGGLDLNEKTLTTIQFVATGSGVRSLNFNGGTIDCTGTGTAWNSAITNFTISGQSTGKIRFSNAAAKTMAGAGNSYPNIELAGAGLLTITGSNTFYDFTNSVQPSGVIFTTATTSTFTNFNLTGAAGNLVVVKSSSTTVKANLSKTSGIVDVDYLEINDTAAAGGATWYAGANSVDGLDNTGWIFTAAPALANSNFFMLFNWDFPNP